MEIVTKNEAPLFLALDIGTSSVRSGLYTHDADLLPETMVKNSRHLTATADGGFEIDGDEALEQVISAIDDIIRKSGELSRRVEFAAVSSFWHSIMGVDADGRPTTKLFAWAETRPANFVAKLKKDLDKFEVHNRTGCPFHSSYWPAKLLWIREVFPEAFAITEKWLSFSDYLGLKIFDEDETSLSMASGTGLLDLRKRAWDLELLDYLGLSEDVLPGLSNESKTFKLNGFYAERWTEFENVNWFPAIGDGAANNAGADCLTESKAALMIGTSGAMRVAYKGDPPDQIPTGLWCYLIDDTHVIVGGAISDGGGLYRWLKENLRLSENDDETERLVAEREPASHGLTFLPFLAGERSTGYNENATGAILGLRGATDQIDIVRAAFESVAYRFADIYERLCSVAEIEVIVASGGALRESPVWTQIICDVIGKNMTLPATREASSRGAVLLAAKKAGLGVKKRDGEQPGTKHFEVNHDKREAYQVGYQIHEHFYNKLVRDVES